MLNKNQSNNDFPQDVAMHVGQPEVAAGIAEGQSFVVEAEQV